MKLNKPTTTLVLSALAFSFAVSAQDFKRVYSTPVKLSSAVNTDAHEESLPILTDEGDKLYFVRTYTSNEGDLKKGDQDIYVSVKENGKYSLASKDLPTLNDKYNNAVMGISSNGKTVYLLNQYQNGRVFNAKGISLSNMKADGTWEEPKVVVMPKINFEGEHYGAYVTPNETTMFFSANLEGSTGEEDLYYTEIDENGRWKKLKSMGPVINSSKADFSPFLSPDGKLLFFSSYGHDSKGEADIFVSERLGKGWDEWSKPEPLVGINTKGFEAYPNIDKSNNIIYSGTGGKKGYSDFYTTKMSLEKIVPKPVEPVKTEEEKAVEKLYAEFDLQLLYFEYNKSDITVDDAIVLDAVYNVMSKFPNLKMVLSGHTDTRGREEYNLKLSQRRADSGKNYLVKKGISKKRIFTQAFGETEPKIVNAKTEEEHRMNRRVTIEIIGAAVADSKK